MKTLRWVLPFVVSALLLAWIFQDIDFRELDKSCKIGHAANSPCENGFAGV